MKMLIGYVAMALVLAAAGTVCWQMGVAERDAADLHAQLETMNYVSASAGSEDFNRRLTYIGLASQLDGDLAAAVRNDRVMGTYWSRQYDQLAVPPAAQGTSQQDPTRLLLAANAMYRTLSTSEVDRQASAQALEGIIKIYGDVLRKSDGNEDAAYNYEFLARRKVARPKPTTKGADKTAAVTGPTTIHGRPGAPFTSVNMEKFKVNVPRQEDERQQELGASQGSQKARKG